MAEDAKHFVDDVQKFMQAGTHILANDKGPSISTYATVAPPSTEMNSRLPIAIRPVSTGSCPLQFGGRYHAPIGRSGPQPPRWASKTGVTAFGGKTAAPLVTGRGS